MIEDILNDIKDRAFWFDEENEMYALYENSWDSFRDYLEEVLEEQLNQDG